MESADNDRIVSRPSHKTLKIDETDFHIPTATTTTEQSFHSKPEKPVQTNGAAALATRCRCSAECLQSCPECGPPAHAEDSGGNEGMDLCPGTSAHDVILSHILSY